MLDKPIDWKWLRRTAEINGVSPLLYRHLKEILPDRVAVPPAFLKKLEKRIQVNTRRNLFLTSELFRVLDILEKARIPVIPYKGPILAATLYGSYALREFGDLDILVRKRDAQRAKDLLLEDGYRFRQETTPARLNATLRSQCHYQLLGCEETFLELHWDITPPHFSLSFDSDKLFENAKPVMIDGRSMRVPNAENLLFMLCVHGGKDYWESLGWIVDIAELVRLHPELDWDKVENLARAAGAERMVRLGAFLAHRLLGAAVPKEILQTAERDRAIKKLYGHVLRQIFEGADYRHRVLKSVAFHMLLRERWFDKIRYFVRWFGIVLTPTEHEWGVIELSDRLFFLYYPIRWIRLLWKYSAFAVNFFRTRVFGRLLRQENLPATTLSTDHLPPPPMTSANAMPIASK